MTRPVVLQTSIPGVPVRRGKVRDIYDLGDRLLLVSTDRISAFDWVLPTGIPDKGRVLTQIAAFWFDLLEEPHHLITTDVNKMDLPTGADRTMLAGRCSLVHRTDVVPIECVVRGYLAGSGWKEYAKSGTVSPDIGGVVRDLKRGQIEYRANRGGVIQAIIGKASFEDEKLIENFRALTEAVVRSRPSAAKGQYLKAITVSSTMGPSVRVDPQAIARPA